MFFVVSGRGRGRFRFSPFVALGLSPFCGVSFRLCVLCEAFSVFALCGVRSGLSPFVAFCFSVVLFFFYVVRFGLGGAGSFRFCPLRR